MGRYEIALGKKPKELPAPVEKKPYIDRFLDRLNSDARPEIRVVRRITPGK